MLDFEAHVTKEQIAFSSLTSAAYASAAVALLFLVLDSLGGAPFSTPSILGSVLLLGQDPATAETANIGIVGLYSLVHFIAFTTLATAATLVYVTQELIRRLPILLSGLILALLSAASILVDAWIIPGLATAIGVIPLLAANVVAAGVIGWFVHASLRLGAESGALAAPAPSRSES